MAILKNKYFWLVLLVMAVTFYIMNATSGEYRQPSIVENLVRGAYTPLQSGVSGFKDKYRDITGLFSNKQDLLKQIEQLEKENNELQLENQALSEYRYEARRLQQLLNFENASLETYDLLPARVIARSPNNWYQTIIIDKGSRDGVKQNMPVIHPSGLVGRVGSVSESSAQINLLTDREVAVGAVLQNSRETRGIVEGVGDSKLLRMVNIPYYSTVKKGDRVLSSGLSEIYPKGLFIGRVIEVKSEPGGLLLTADIEPEVNFDKLEEVLLITDYHPLEEDSVAEKTGE